MNERSPAAPNHNPDALVVHQSESFSGPLPHPDILKKFDEVAPGAAERIIKMAEAQSAHRRELEKAVITSDIARSKWGQVLGFFIAVIGLVSSAFIAIYGNAIAGGVIGASTLAALVGVFMYGASTRSRERSEKGTD